MKFFRSVGAKALALAMLAAFATSVAAQESAPAEPVPNPILPGVYSSSEHVPGPGVPAIPVDGLELVFGFRLQTPDAVPWFDADGDVDWVYRPSRTTASGATLERPPRTVPVVDASGVVLCYAYSPEGGAAIKCPASRVPWIDRKGGASRFLPRPKAGAPIACPKGAGVLADANGEILCYFNVPYQTFAPNDTFGAPKKGKVPVFTGDDLVAWVYRPARPATNGEAVERPARTVPVLDSRGFVLCYAYSPKGGEPIKCPAGEIPTIGLKGDVEGFEPRPAAVKPGGGEAAVDGKIAVRDADGVALCFRRPVAPVAPVADSCIPIFSGDWRQGIMDEERLAGGKTILIPEEGTVPVLNSDGDVVCFVSDSGGKALAIPKGRVPVINAKGGLDRCCVPRPAKDGETSDIVAECDSDGAVLWFVEPQDPQTCEPVAFLMPDAILPPGKVVAFGEDGAELVARPTGKSFSPPSGTVPVLNSDGVVLCFARAASGRTAITCLENKVATIDEQGFASLVARPKMGDFSLRTRSFGVFDDDHKLCYLMSLTPKASEYAAYPVVEDGVVAKFGTFSDATAAVALVAPVAPVAVAPAAPVSADEDAVSKAAPAPAVAAAPVAPGSIKFHKTSKPVGDVGANVWRNSIGMEFRRIPAGKFTMGSPVTEVGRECWGSDETQREVTISQEFYMSVYETRQSDFAAFYHDAAGERSLFYNPSAYVGSERPVDRVEWIVAMNFAATLNKYLGKELAKRFGEGARYDLPTEAQWEYACRAGTETTYAFGDSCDGSQANVHGGHSYPPGTAPGDYVGGTTAVGMYPPNAWGLYDMHGNVWEWCLDWYAPYDEKDTVDPVNLTGRGLNRVLRGGAWAASAFCARSAHRVNDSDILFSDNAPNVGFRLVIIPGDKEPLLKVNSEWTREQVESTRRRYEAKIGIE